MIRIKHSNKDVQYNGPMRCIRGYGLGTKAERAAEGLLNEGLLRTYPVDETGRIISRMFSGLKKQYDSFKKSKTMYRLSLDNFNPKFSRLFPTNRYLVHAYFDTNVELT